MPSTLTPLSRALAPNGISSISSSIGSLSASCIAPDLVFAAVCLRAVRLLYSRTQNPYPTTRSLSMSISISGAMGGLLLVGILEGTSDSGGRQWFCFKLCQDNDSHLQNSASATEAIPSRTASWVVESLYTWYSVILCIWRLQVIYRVLVLSEQPEDVSTGQCNPTEHNM